MKEFEVTLYFHSNATVKVLAESEDGALEQVRNMDLSEQIQNGLLEEGHDITSTYRVPNGVIINDGSIPAEDLNLLLKDGHLILSVGEEIEYEDIESGELVNLTIKEFGNNYMICNKIAADGTLLATYTVPFNIYLAQLEDIGALDDYPAIIKC